MIIYFNICKHNIYIIHLNNDYQTLIYIEFVILLIIQNM